MTPAETKDQTVDAKTIRRACFYAACYHADALRLVLGSPRDAESAADYVRDVIRFAIIARADPIELISRVTRDTMGKPTEHREEAMALLRRIQAETP